MSTDSPEESTNGIGSRIEHVALRKLVYSLAGNPDPEETNVVEAAGMAAERINDLEREVAGARDELQELDGVVESLRDIGENKTSKEQKVAAIVSFADNIRDDGQPEVTVAAQEIKGAAGVTRRYAYDLIEDVAEEYAWADVRDARSQPSGKDGGRKIQWKKALAVDFEQLHKDPESVNKFTTEVAG